MSDPEQLPTAGRDIAAEEAVLEEFLGSTVDRRARFETEVMAEAAAAIERVGWDWGLPEFSELSKRERDDLLKSALADPNARSVVEGYVALLQGHRAEFLAKVLHPSEPTNA